MNNNLKSITDRLRMNPGREPILPTEEQYERMSPQEQAAIQQMISRGYKNTSVGGAIGGLGRWTQNQGYRLAGYSQDSIQAAIMSGGIGMLGRGAGALASKISKKTGVDFSSRKQFTGPLAKRVMQQQNQPKTDPALLNAINDLSDKIGKSGGGEGGLGGSKQLSVISGNMREMSNKVALEVTQGLLLENLKTLNETSKDTNKSVKSIEDLYIENSLDKLERAKEEATGVKAEGSKVSLIETQKAAAVSLTDKFTGLIDTVSDVTSIIDDMGDILGKGKGGFGGCCCDDGGFMPGSKNKRPPRGRKPNVLSRAGSALKSAATRAAPYVARALPISGMVRNPYVIGAAALGATAYGAYSLYNLGSPTGGERAIPQSNNQITNQKSGYNAQRSRIGGGKASQTVADSIDEAAKRVGVDRATMYAIARQESGFNPSAKAGTSSASGLYQFLDGTWNDMVSKYGNQYPELSRGKNDPTASALAGALYVRENTEALKAAGVNPSAENLYAMHFLGAGGGRRFLTAPTSDPAFMHATPQAVSANKNVFEGRTVGQVREILFGKVGRDARQLQGMFDKGFSGVQATAQNPNKIASSQPDKTAGRNTVVKPEVPNRGAAATAVQEKMTNSEKARMALGAGGPQIQYRDMPISRGGGSQTQQSAVNPPASARTPGSAAREVQKRDIKI